MWKRLKNSNNYFIAFKGDGENFQVSYSAQLPEIMSLVHNMIIEDENVKKVFVDFNQAGDA